MKFFSKVYNFIAGVGTPTQEGGIGWDVTGKRIQVFDGATLQKLMYLADKVSQAEAVAATDDAKFMTALRTKDFYDSKKASQAIVNAGTDDELFVTALKFKTFFDSLVFLTGAFDYKEGCVICTNTNITLSGLQTLQSVSLPSGKRIMVNGQTSAVNNGIWVTSAGAWTRATDCDQNAEVTQGFFVTISQGTFAGAIFKLDGEGSGTNGQFQIGIDPLVFTQPKIDISQWKASQSQVNTGTDDINFVTALKNKTYFDGRKASQAQADARTDDTQFITAAKLPKFLFKKITGNAATANDVLSVAHGLALAKIVSVTAFINYNSNTQKMLPSVNVAGFLFYCYYDSSNVYLDMQGATSLDSQPYTIFITYEP